VGSPVAGLSNAQTWAQYGIAIAGAVAPCAATRAEIAGFVCDGDSAPAAPSLAIGNVSVTEGHGATLLATFTVTLSPTSTQTVTVNYATANGTATAGSDYAAKSGTLIFAPGVRTRPISVIVNGDTTVEPDETFTVTLSGPANAVLGTATGTGTILNDDTVLSLPRLVVGHALVTEGHSGTTSATFTVTLSPVSTQTVTVNYATANGTATAGSDYVAKSGTLIFAPGVRTRPINIAVMGDTTPELHETFRVTLSNPTKAVLGAAVPTGTGIILNDDDSRRRP
jgi:chitinase